MPNYFEGGLLSGVSEGIKGGLAAYNTIKDRKDKMAMAEMDEETKRKALARQLANDDLDAKVKIGGLLKDGGAEVVNAKTPSNFTRLKIGDTELAFDPGYKSRATAVANADKEDARRFSQSAELRKEYLGLPTSKASQDLAMSYGNIRDAALNPSAAGDLKLIFNYMKMLDPGSTVREGEFANAQNAAGIPERIINMYNRASKGERLNPDTRADFVSQAGSAIKSQIQRQKALESQYKDKASKFKLDPDQVLTNLFANLNPEEFDSLPLQIKQAAIEQAKTEPGLLSKLGNALFGTKAAAVPKEQMAGAGLLGAGQSSDPEGDKRRARIQELKAKLGK